MHSTNYTNTFIAIAEDSGADRGPVPPEKADKLTIAGRTYQLIAGAPYAYTSDDVIFTVWADRKDIPEVERPAARDEFFSKVQACLRASDLGKTYGWGIHHDSEGRIALYSVDSDQYRALVESSDAKVVKAMRSSRH